MPGDAGLRVWIGVALAPARSFSGRPRLDRRCAVVVRWWPRTRRAFSRARGSSRRRVNAAASARDHGQSRSSLSCVRRPCLTSLPATCSSRCRRRFGSALASSPVQADQPGPAEQVLGDQRDLQPGLVVLEGVVREVAHAGVLAGADRVLNAGAAAVTQLQDGDVVAFLVGEEARVPVTVLVEDRELRAGVRTLAAADQPGTFRPLGQVHAVCQLRHPGAVPILAGAVDRLYPRRFWDFEDRSTNRLGQLVPNREADPGFAAVRGERVRAPADIGADQDLPVEVLGGQLLQREPEHGEVIGGRVRAGVPRSEDRRQRLAGLIQPAAERMKPVPVLVVPGRHLLLRVRGQQRRVDVQRDRLRPGARVPHPRPGRRPSRPNRGRATARRSTSAPDGSSSPTLLRRTAAPGPDTRPCRSRSRRRRRASPPRHAAPGPDRAPSDAHAWPPTPPTDAVGQPDAIGQLDQQRDPRVRDQTLAVRRHFYRSETSLWLHQLGVLLGRDCRPSATRILTAREDVPTSPTSARYRRFEVKRGACAYASHQYRPATRLRIVRAGVNAGRASRQRQRDPPVAERRHDRCVCRVGGAELLAVRLVRAGMRAVKAWVLVVTVAAVWAGSWAPAAAFGSGTSGLARRSAVQASYYLALGDSVAIASGTSSYPYLLLANYRRKLPGLRLSDIAVPGATTSSVLEGQYASALGFLQAHKPASGPDHDRHRR